MTFLTAQKDGRSIPAVMDASMAGFGDPEYEGAQTAPCFLQCGFSYGRAQWETFGSAGSFVPVRQPVVARPPFWRGVFGSTLTKDRTMNIPSKSRTLSASDLDTTDTKEPRIHDERLGERLGLSRPRDIRKLIDRNRAELEGYGLLRQRGAPIKSGKGRIQEVQEYWLNEGQAMLICMFARTDDAADVRREIIQVFLAWRRGSLPTRLPRWQPSRADMRDINSRASQILQTRFSAVRDALLAQIKQDRAAGHVRPLSDYSVEPTALIAANDPGMPDLDDGQALFMIDGRPVRVDFTAPYAVPDADVIAIPVADGTGPERFTIEGDVPAASWFDRCYLAKPRNSRDLIRPVVVVIGTIIKEGSSEETRRDDRTSGDHRGFDHDGM